MRQVQTCDFCGADAAGLYEPLPASTPDSPRLALCAGCRDRLASVVDPLLARLDEDGSPADAPDASGGAADDAGGSGVAETGGSAGGDREPTGGGRDAGRGTPPGYRKVMRFLENRTLPVEREEAQLLAAEAYDLPEDAVDAVIDHAVQYGRLREVDGELKR